MAHSTVDGYSGPKNAKPRRMGKVSAIVEKRGYGIEARARERERRRRRRREIRDRRRERRDSTGRGQAGLLEHGQGEG